MPETESTTAHGRNGFDPDLVAGFVNRIETLHDDLLSEKSDYMHRAKAIRNDVTSVYDEAKDAGLAKKALKAVIKARDLEARAKAARDDLEDDLSDTFDNIRLALGDLADLPLGQAAEDGKVTQLPKRKPAAMPETKAAPAQG